MTDFVNIKIASTFDELSNALNLRENIFVKNQGLDYNAEFDGNDLSATHLLAYINQEAVGTMRIRYFKDFVKFERVCVLPKYRKTNVSELMMNEAGKFCAAKGYDTVHGVCEKELLPRWAKIGAVPIKGAPISFQHGLSLVPIEQKLPKASETINLKTSPEILNRKEGEWFDSSPIFGAFELRTKEQIARFNKLSQKVKLIKTFKQPQNSDWHPPLKDNSKTY